MRTAAIWRMVWTLRRMLSAVLWVKDSAQSPPMRTKARPRLAAATLALDALKAVPVVLAAKWLALPIMWQGLVGLAVLLGHSFPLWYGFRGGKAVASAFGVLLVLVPSVALLSALAWALMAWRLGTAALASVASALLAPLLCAWLAPAYTGVVGGFSLLVLARHMLNIRRWRQGEEPPLRK